MPDRLTPHLLRARVQPLAAFRMLEGRASDVFWLDAGAHATEGWSFIGTGEPAPLPAEVRLDVAAPTPGLPPFLGGWVGWRDYESGAAAAGAPTHADAESPQRSWLKATHVVAFDHASGQVWTLSDPVEEESWADTVGSVAALAATDESDVPPAEPRVADARHDPLAYAALIERCRDLIRAGIAYQLCLTTRFTVDGTHDAVDVYQRLRAATPAHHGGFVRIDGRTLLSASPEQFLHAAGGVIRTRPIKASSGVLPRTAST